MTNNFLQRVNEAYDYLKKSGYSDELKIFSDQTSDAWCDLYIDEDGQTWAVLAEGECYDEGQFNLMIKYEE